MKKTEIKMIAFLLAIPIMLFLLGIALVSAQSSYSNCYDNSTLSKHTFVNITVNNQLKTIDWTENVVCSFGCDSVNNDCRPDTFFTILLTIIFLIGFVALLYWLYRKV